MAYFFVFCVMHIVVHVCWGLAESLVHLIRCLALAQVNGDSQSAVMQSNSILQLVCAFCPPHAPNPSQLNTTSYLPSRTSSLQRTSQCLCRTSSTLGVQILHP
ncbi:hypothetical protein BDQ17DRAFT_684315 [Cyathus striatus]|nr:hypothetical protein BDQ17DRAFT_684315 [Cyathus striatus]